MAISATPKDLILVALSLFILHYLTKSLLLHRHNRAFAKSHGCKPPRRLPCGIFGLREFRLLAHAVNEGEIIEFVCSRFKPGWYTFVMSDMGLQVIRTIDPENIKTILATSFKDYSLGSIRRDASEPMLGHGIFTLDGEGWEYSRALLRPQFTREQVADVEMMDEHVGRMLELMQRGGKDGAVVDLQPWFFCLTLDTATEFMFGESAKSLLMGEDDQSGFAYSFKQAVAWILWKIQYHQISNMFTPRAMKVANRDCHRFVDEYVHKALNRDKFPLAENLRGRYVFLDAVAQTNRNPKALRDQMLNVLLAGRDTTAGMLGWTFYLLARNPRVYKKLRDDLEAAFGTGVPGVWNRPTFEGLKDVPYLRHVLNEVLRLYPPVPFNQREAIRDTVLPTGGGEDGLSPIFIPKGMTVTYAVYQLHRRKDFYGEDAEEFRPERWEEKTVGRAWEYLPFNGGPRICLGQQYALTEGGFTVARIMQHYERMEAPDADDKVRMDATCTMSPKTALVRLFPVQS